MLNREIISKSEEGFAGTMIGTRETAANAALHGDKPIEYDAKFWEDLANRKGSTRRGSRLTPTELEIQQKLQTRILVNFDDDRARATASLLDEFARDGHQILAFTCHRHLADTFLRSAPTARLETLPAHA